MNRFIVKYYILVLCQLGFYQALSQDVFHTKAAQINIKVRHHGHVSSFWSDKLVVLLDYSDATFVANLQKENIHSDDKLLLDELNGLSDNGFELSGKFGMDHIETSSHTPIEFDYKGTLSYADNIITVSGLGRLEHIDGSYIACLLSFKFALDSSILPVEIKERHTVDDISVEVLQSVLKPKNY